jgi:dihydrofolate synthase / folylpolyglutamate synthase
MLDKKEAAGKAQPQHDWTFSPVPAVELAVNEIRLKSPPMLPNGLDRPKQMLAKLGNPQHKMPPVFHVAGTNGKGSTLAFLQSMFEAGGLTVHKFISPHLVRFEERIVVAGKQIEPDHLLELIGEVKRAAGDDEISFFEFFTALAFLIYSRTPADAVLLETGLGGNYDATNVIEKSIALLTRISYDHTRLLGDTLPAIAGEKAGIIKRGCPTIVAPQSPEVNEVFLRRAAEMGAPTFVAGLDWSTEVQGNAFTYQGKNKFTLPLPKLLGGHQVINAGTAIAGLENSPFTSLLKQDTLSKAMETVTWPGRFQQLTRGHLADLLPKGWELWADGAHNDSGAEVLAAQAKAWGDEKPLHIITGFKKKKDTDGFYERLVGIPKSIQAVDARIDAPLVPPQELCDSLKAMGFANAQPADNLESAIRSLALQFTTPQRIIITGSLYLVGHALKLNG